MTDINSCLTTGDCVAVYDRAFSALSGTPPVALLQATLLPAEPRVAAKRQAPARRGPVMIIVARARLLPPSEGDHLRPLAATILSHAHSAPPTLNSNDALLGWFEPATAAFIRGIEQNGA